MNKVLALSLASLSLLPVATLAQAPELFIPVTGSEETIVRTKNDYFLKRELYFAKRHRIVRVDSALLLQRDGPPDRITVNLFDDVKLLYEVTQPIRPSGDHRLLSFKAQLVNSPTSIDELRSLNSSLTRAGAEQVLRSIYQLSVTGRQYVHDPVRDRYWPTFLINDHGYGCPASQGHPKQLKPTAETFYAFSSEIMHPFTNEKYILTYPYSDPRYNVIWQIDPSKTIVTPDDPAAAIQWSSEQLKRENEVKRRAYAEFLGYLGDDPRQATEERDLCAFREALDDM